MKRIGILSDTHSYLDPALKDFFSACDEIWHAGDWGDVAVVNELKTWKPVRGVFGNIDGQSIKTEFPEQLDFTLENLRVTIIHIAGYPGHYSPKFRQVMKTLQTDLLVCGHSHILRVLRDPKHGWLVINPGACGKHGFQQVNTAVRLVLDAGRPRDLEIWEKKRN